MANEILAVAFFAAYLDHDESHDEIKEVELRINRDWRAEEGDPPTMTRGTSILSLDALTSSPCRRVARLLNSDQ